jgi:tetratricopeptide (TPR) repeat protein
VKSHPDDLALRELAAVFKDERAGLIVHVLGCDDCRERMLALLAGEPAPGPVPDNLLSWPKHGAGCLGLRDLGAGEEHRLSALLLERVEAKGLLLHLLPQPQERRTLIVENSPRFHTWGVLELLIDQALATRVGGSGEELGSLALRVADRLDVATYGAERIMDLRARAWASIGNSRRIRADLQGANEAMSTAFSHLRRGTADLVERAILLDLKASLLRAQRRFGQALRVLQRAYSIFAEYGDQHRAGRVLVQMDTVHFAAGNPELGIPLLYQAIEMIDPDAEPYLVVAIRHNLIDGLTDLGCFAEARAQLERAAPSYRSFQDGSTQGRLKWVEGKIARGLGEPAAAEACFLAARDAFLSLEVSYDAALVSLDLAVLYAQQKRIGELRSLSEEILHIFASRGIEREALAVLLCLRHAESATQAS